MNHCNHFKITGITVEKEQGTGLGLSIVYNIIKEHSGSIVVERNKDRGTEFIVKLATFIK